MELNGINSVVRILDDQLDCFLGDETYAFSFDLETANGGEIELAVTVYRDIENTDELDTTFTFSAAVRDLSFPGYEDYLTIDNAHVNVTVMSEYHVFLIQEVAVTGQVDIARIGLFNAQFGGNLNILDY